MVHCLDRLRYTAVDALVRIANSAPKKRIGTIFLILNLTHVVAVSPALLWCHCVRGLAGDT